MALFTPPVTKAILSPGLGHLAVDDLRACLGGVGDRGAPAVKSGPPFPALPPIAKGPHPEACGLAHKESGRHLSATS